MEPPFIVGPVVEPPYFIDRQEELAKMTTTLQSLAENLVIMAQRRMGKSSLIHNASKAIEESGAIHVAHVDCRRITGPLAFTDTIIEATLAAYASHNPVKAWLAIRRRLMKDAISDVLTSIGTIGVQAVKDIFHAYIEFREKKRSEASMLEEAFRFLQAFTEERRVGLVIMLDEFQQLRGLLDGHVFQLFKSYSDQLRRVRFVFSGSSVGLLHDVFQKPNSPMYMMAGRISLAPLREADVVVFVMERLQKAGVAVDADAAALYHSLTGGIPHYVQKLGLVSWLHALQDRRGRIDAGHVLLAFDTMLYEFNSEFEGRFNDKFGQAQRAILTALAEEERLKRVDIATATNRTTGQLSVSLNGLEDAMVITKLERGVYAISDPVFRAWIYRRVLGLP